MKDVKDKQWKDKNCNSYKSNDDTKCSTGKVVHFFIAFQLFRMRDWKATKGPVSLPLSPKAESQQQSTQHSLLQQESVILQSHNNNNKQLFWILDLWNTCYEVG